MSDVKIQFKKCNIHSFRIRPVRSDYISNATIIDLVDLCISDPSIFSLADDSLIVASIHP